MKLLVKNVRLKAGIEENQIENRLRFNPEIVELHLNEEDLIEKTRLITVIERLQNLGIQVYLHHPMSVGNTYLDILTEDKNVQEYYSSSTKELVEICHKYKIKCVIHAHYSGTVSSDHVDLAFTLKMKEAIEHVQAFGKGVLLWEDTIDGAFSYQNPYLISEIIEPLNLPLVLDTSHSFISLNGSNEKLIQVLKRVKPYVQYAHIVDSKGEIHDNLSLGKGLIEWKRIVPFLKEKPFIFEIGLVDVTDCNEMIQSVTFWNDLIENK
jgi:sugar phosphate isomerase/epimerase